MSEKSNKLKVVEKMGSVTAITDHGDERIKEFREQTLKHLESAISELEKSSGLPLFYVIAVGYADETTGERSVVDNLGWRRAGKHTPHAAEIIGWLEVMKITVHNVLFGHPETDEDNEDE